MHRSMGEPISNILRPPLHTGLTVFAIVIWARPGELVERARDR